MKVLAKYRLTDLIWFVLAIGSLIQTVSHHNLLWGIASVFLFFLGVIEPVI